MRVWVFINLARYPEGIDGMVFVSPFSDFRQITRETMGRSWLTWAIQWPASLTIDTQYNPVDYVSTLPTKPKVFIYSAEDRVIAANHVIKLYEHASDEKHLEQVKGYHNSLFSKKENQQLILRYLNKWSE